jgi:hypothetical protein
MCPITLTLPISIIDLDLYDASAFARAKCICLHMRIPLVGIVQTEMTNQEEVVLNQVVSEVLLWQRSVTQLRYKFMLGIFLPGFLDIISL